MMGSNAVHVLRTRIFDSWLLALGIMGLASACRMVDPDHCAHRMDTAGRTTDAWCMAAHALPYCDRCRPSDDRGGCSTERPVRAECMPTERSDDGSDTGTSESSSGPEPLVCEREGFDEACAMLDPRAPFCIDGACEPCDDALCPEGACAPRPSEPCVACRPDAESACPSHAPWCGAGLTCTDACTRHEQCPESACDLAAGACLPSEATLAWVDGSLEHVDVPSEPSQCRRSLGADWRSPPTYCDIDTALADAPNPAVIRVRAMEQSYRGAWAIGEQRTVVVMADPAGGPVLVQPSGTIATHVVHTSPSSRVYVQGFVMRKLDELGSTLGIECAGASGQVTELWLDDMEVIGFDAGVRTDGCNLHVRRSSIHDSQGAGIEVTGRSVTIESSVVARNAEVGVRATGTTVDLLFSSLLGNDAAGGLNDTLNLECVGTTMGSLVGSLVLHPRGPSIQCGNEALFPARSVTDDDLDGGYRELEELFSDVTRGALRDPATNPITELGVPWEPGDPYVDIDGEIRPRPDRPLVTPGANQP